MNLKLWFGMMFSNNRTDDGLAGVRGVGKSDGQAMTNAYADGFLDGVGEVLHARLNGFHQVIETTSTPAPPIKKITARRK
jgi:hypothetical protein